MFFNNYVNNVRKKTKLIGVDGRRHGKKHTTTKP